MAPYSSAVVIIIVGSYDNYQRVTISLYRRVSPQTTSMSDSWLCNNCILASTPACEGCMIQYGQ